MKKLLNKKTGQELKEMKQKNSSTYSIMEDFYNIILLEDYSDDYIQKMISTPNLLGELTNLWQDDDRVLELQEKILKEFLEK